MLSVVVPCFDEVAVVGLLCERLRRCLDALGEPYEVVFVDDGSTDGTRARLAAEAAEWPHARVVALVANVGHQAALAAGLDAAAGDYVVTMDADLQDPPELIPELLRRARSDGADVVYAVRDDRTTDTVFKRWTASLYYRVLARASGIPLCPHAGDFRLVSARVAAILRALPERQPVYRMIVPALGFPSATVPYARAARAAGRSKYSIARMAGLTVRSVTVSSMLPLRLAAAAGFGAALCCLLFAAGAVVAVLLGHTVPGWASLMTAILFVGAVQLACLGVLGEYVGRVLEELRGRPRYVVDEEIRAAEPARQAS